MSSVPLTQGLWTESIAEALGGDTAPLLCLPVALRAGAGEGASGQQGSQPLGHRLQPQLGNRSSEPGPWRLSVLESSLAVEQQFLPTSHRLPPALGGELGGP